MSYVGYYINLDCSIGRRAAVEAQFARPDLTDTYARSGVAMCVHGTPLGSRNGPGWLAGELAVAAPPDGSLPSPRNGQIGRCSGEFSRP